MEVRLVQLRPYEALGVGERLTHGIFVPAVRSSHYPIQHPETFRSALRAQTFRQSEQSFTILALHAGQPIGAVVGHGYAAPTTPWFLKWLVVHPDFQGHGVGARLHDAALTHVTAREAHGQTHESATAACSFYRSRGWVLAPRADGWINLTRDLPSRRSHSSRDGAPE